LTTGANKLDDFVVFNNSKLLSRYTSITLSKSLVTTKSSNLFAPVVQHPF